MADLIEGIGGIIGGGSGAPGYSGSEYAALDAEVSGGVTAEYDLAQMIAALQEEGFKVYLDTASGVKIKISAGEELVKEIIGDVDLPVDASGMTFTAADFDLYLVFNAEGKFTQFGLDVNVAANYSVKEGANEATSSLSIKCGVSVKTFSGKVTIPEGIAEDTKYQLQTM